MQTSPPSPHPHPYPQSTLVMRAVLNLVSTFFWISLYRHASCRHYILPIQTPHLMHSHLRKWCCFWSGLSPPSSEPPCTGRRNMKTSLENFGARIGVAFSSGLHYLPLNLLVQVGVTWKNLMHPSLKILVLELVLPSIKTSSPSSESPCTGRCNMKRFLSASFDGYTQLTSRTLVVRVVFPLVRTSITFFWTSA